MKALAMNQSGELIVREVPQPEAHDRNMIVRVLAASICGTDMRTYLKGNKKVPPFRTMGHEFSGVVESAGSLAGQYGFTEGMRISAAPVIGCGICRLCRSGYSNLCDRAVSIGYELEGAFAEYLEIPEQALRMGNVIVLPEQIPADEGALIEPAACVLNGQSYLHIGPGDTVAVYGSGVIAAIHAETALEQGADKVIMIGHGVRRGHNLKEKIPSLQYIDAQRENTVARTAELTGGYGADVVITAVSDPQAQEEAQVIAAKRGRISLFGGLPGESRGHLDANLIHYKELQIFGSSATTAVFMKQVAEKIAAGKLNLEKYIERRIPLADAAQGFAAIRDEKVLKVVMHPDIRRY